MFFSLNAKHKLEILLESQFPDWHLSMCQGRQVSGFFFRWEYRVLSEFLIIGCRGVGNINRNEKNLSMSSSSIVNSM